MNRIVRLIAVFALLVGVCSPAICSTLCALGAKCGSPVVVSTETAPKKKCPNCPEPPSHGYQVGSSEDCCCGWIAKKADPPATPAALIGVVVPVADLPIVRIEVPTPAAISVEPILVANDRAPPGPSPGQVRDRAPPQ